MYRSPLPALALLGVTAFIVAAPAAVAEPDSGAAYLGRWNYDFPDHSTMLNYATENIPGAPDAPQIGDIIFTSSGAGRVTGRTDVGCTWEFESTADGLTLDPPNQTCHNPTFGYTYTTTAWTVRVRGDQETESVTAISHHQDADYIFILQHGARTRAREDDPDAAKAFEGTSPPTTHSRERSRSQGITATDWSPAPTTAAPGRSSPAATPPNSILPSKPALRAIPP